MLTHDSNVSVLHMKRDHPLLSRATGKCLGCCTRIGPPFLPFTSVDSQNMLVTVPVGFRIAVTRKQAGKERVDLTS